MLPVYRAFPLIGVNAYLYPDQNLRGPWLPRTCAHRAEKVVVFPSGSVFARFVKSSAFPRIVYLPSFLPSIGRFIPIYRSHTLASALMLLSLFPPHHLSTFLQFIDWFPSHPPPLLTRTRPYLTSPLLNTSFRYCSLSSHRSLDVPYFTPC